MGGGAQPDEELLRRHNAGDPDAFVAYYRRNLSAILSFFLRRTRDAELTADLTAEVFAAALLAAPRFRPGGAPARAWLYGIAAHKLIDSRRRGRVEDQARRRLALEPLIVDDLDLQRVEELAGHDDQTAALESAVAGLPDGSAMRSSPGSSRSAPTPTSLRRCGAPNCWSGSGSAAA